MRGEGELGVTRPGSCVEFWREFGCGRSFSSSSFFLEVLFSILFLRFDFAMNLHFRVRMGVACARACVRV